MNHSNTLMKAARVVLASCACAAATALGATITVEFEPAPGVTPDYRELQVEIGDLKKEGAWKNATKRITHEPTFKETFTVPTGNYLVRVFTGPSEEMSNARPGAFYTYPLFARLTNELSTEKFVFEYRPLDLDALKGSATRVVKVVDSEGQPANGVELNVSALFSQNTNEDPRPYLLGRYHTGSDGTLRLERMAPERMLAFTDTNGIARGNLQSNEVLVITLPRRVGAAAPDFSFTEINKINTGQQHRLSELRGRIVVLDFWATWCGPCQKAIAELQTLHERRPHWGDKVRILTVSLDATLEKARTHLKKNDWLRTDNGWAGPSEFDSPAAKAYNVAAIPNTWIIDAQGRIAGSGTGSFDSVVAVDSLLGQK
jgi:thiol-disulfide isomerase/thioredoxin